MDNKSQSVTTFVNVFAWDKVGCDSVTLWSDLHNRKHCRGPLFQALAKILHKKRPEITL